MLVDVVTGADDADAVLVDVGAPGAAPSLAVNASPAGAGTAAALLVLSVPAGRVAEPAGPVHATSANASATLPTAALPSAARAGTRKDDEVAINPPNAKRTTRRYRIRLRVRSAWRKAWQDHKHLVRRYQESLGPEDRG